MLLLFYFILGKHAGLLLQHSFIFLPILHPQQDSLITHLFGAPNCAYGRPQGYAPTRGYLHITHFNKFNASPYGVSQRNSYFFLIHSFTHSLICYKVVDRKGAPLHLFTHL